MYKAEKLYAPTRSIPINNNMALKKQNYLRATAARAAQLDPLEAEYFFKLGRISTYLGDSKRAQQDYLQACLVQPTSGSYLQQLGLSLYPEQFDLRNKLLADGIQRSPLNLSLYLTYSNWLMINDQRRNAFSILNKAMKRIPWEIPAVIDFILPLRFPINEVEQQLAEIPAAWYEVGRRLERAKLPDKAELFYRRSIELAGTNDAQSNTFNHLYRLYLNQKNEKKALETLRLGISYLPDHAQFRVLLGDYYLSKGIAYRAQEEYVQALRLDPKNRSVQLKLEKMRSEN